MEAYLIHQVIKKKINKKKENFENEGNIVLFSDLFTSISGIIILIYMITLIIAFWAILRLWKYCPFSDLVKICGTLAAIFIPGGSFILLLITFIVDKCNKKKKNRY